MKKCVTIFSIFLFLSFYINTAPAVAELKTFTQGIYTFEDTGFAVGATYTVSNKSPTGSSIIIIFDSNRVMQEFIRLDANSPSYPLKPLDYNSLLVVIGPAPVQFS